MPETNRPRVDGVSRLIRLFRDNRITGITGIPKDDLQALRWLLSLRNRVAIALLFMLAIASLIQGIPVQATVSLLLLNCLFLATNVLYRLLIRGNPPPRMLGILRQVMIPVDMVINTIVIYVSGGTLSPLFITYPVAILVSIILLDPRGVYRTAAIAVLLYCGLALAEAYRALPHVDVRWGTVSFHDIASPQTYGLYVLAVCSMVMVAGYMGNRIALSIRQRNALIESQLGDLRTLYTITEGLSAIMDEDEIVRYVATTLKSTQNALMCVVALAGQSNVIEVKASGDTPTDLLVKVRATCFDAPGAIAVLREGKPLILTDMEQHPEFRDLFGPQARSAYMFPIKSEAVVLGLIGLVFNEHRPLGPEYQNMLANIASQVASALQRARLFCDAQRLASQMSTLYDAGLYTGSTLSKDEVLSRISTTIEQLLDPDAYYVALYDDIHNRLNVEVMVEHGYRLPKLNMSLDTGGLTAHIVRSHQPLLINDWLSEHQKYEQMQIAKRMGNDMLSYLGVPMVIENRLIGVISVQHSRPNAFDASHERLLMALAAQTAMALENARLHQVAQDQARLDSLTQVYNHGSFIAQVRQAVEASDRNDTQVSLIMLDIDYFKQYNDSFGHVAGDNVLRMVANALKSSVRDTDVVGRWGGEEFGVLLVGAGVSEAKKVARSIQYAVSVLYPVDASGKVIPNPTVSQGISSYPYPSSSANELIEDADVALYYAKIQGRNQIVVYDKNSEMRETRYTTANLSRPLKKIITSPSLPKL
jgi:diguanylate cyclase (GGDEF)-like protein